jgi:hypothetical protein
VQHIAAVTSRLVRQIYGGAHCWTRLRHCRESMTAGIMTPTLLIPMLAMIMPMILSAPPPTKRQFPTQTRARSKIRRSATTPTTTSYKISTVDPTLLAHVPSGLQILAYAKIEKMNSGHRALQWNDSLRWRCMMTVLL